MVQGWFCTELDEVQDGQVTLTQCNTHFSAFNHTLSRTEGGFVFVCDLNSFDGLLWWYRIFIALFGWL